MRRSPARWRAAATIGAAACALAACTSAKPTAQVAAAAPQAAVSDVPAAEVTTSATTADAVSPLSGRPAKAGLPVVVVKVDNVAGAFPQAGLNDADVVYVEEVEGGLTRLTTVFSSRTPAMVGPVRSARTDNIQLLKQFGRPAIAYSGANDLVLRAVRASVLRSADFDSFPGPYRRMGGNGHVAPHNLFLTDFAAVVEAKHPSPAKFAELTFADRVDGGKAARRVTVQYERALLQFDFDAKSRRWLLSQDGHEQRLVDGSRVAASNVILQEVIQRRDPNGHITPFNETIGGGRSSVLRDGKVFGGMWRRHTEAAGTHYRDATGKDVALLPGVTWVVLLPKDATATVTG
jgi:hypothetical protein